MHQNNICIIPARGGSKRILRKNIKVFLGKPIIAYSVDAALRSGLFAEVMVSTDDEEIAEIATYYGAKVPFLRSPHTSDDFATTLDVLREVYNRYTNQNYHFKNICCIYPTAPFVNSEKLKSAYDLLINGQFDSVLPILRYSFPIQRSFIKKDEGKIAYLYEEFKNTRSQDLQPSFHDAGQFYWLKPEVLTLNSIITARSGGIEISELEGQDIDNENDWKLAELKYELLQNVK
ncbi:pseudaminic acid cytidylyltransferase [Pseudopedobacter sp.]|uniref:pseudaminic acid cytidylyltransferase n=1 Tax=Pseudopedobacter sp. TaxID=1936787 RepID=UPI0033422926